jgi:hypothetical protein
MGDTMTPGGLECAMKRIVKKLPEKTLREEAQMRAFYALCGISERTAEAAILMRRKNPVEEEKSTPSAVGRPRKASGS